MDYKVYYGEMTPPYKANWENEGTDPFLVVADLYRMDGQDWMAFLSAARRLLRDEIQIDWGSFAWKASKEEILKLSEEWKATLESVDVLQEEKEYAVVFIEMS